MSIDTAALSAVAKMTAEGAEEEAIKEADEVIDKAALARPKAKAGEQVTAIGDKFFVARVEQIPVECGEWVRSNYESGNRILLDAFYLVMRSEGRYSAKPAEWASLFIEFANREV